MFDTKKILVEPLVDGNPSPKEPFCTDGNWTYWGEMTPQQKEKVVNRKITIAGASRKEDEETFWLGIAELNEIKWN
jgi:hypothetical protein